MDNFRRYCTAYLTRLPHPFLGTQVRTLDPGDLEELVEFTSQLLSLEVKERQLSDLTARFASAFEQYLVVSRDQVGAIMNAVERLAVLLEPYLKKLAYICYPHEYIRSDTRRVPLWHHGMERILKHLGYVSANLKQTDEAYWRDRDVEAATWRVAYVSRHKGAHEAHQYSLPELERVAQCVLACYLFAAERALKDPQSASQRLRIDTETRRLNALLTARSETYGVTQELLSPVEHLRLYAARDRLTLNEQKIRLLLRGHLAGRGPVYAFLRPIPLPVRLQWVRECLGDDDPHVRSRAAEFLIRHEEAVDLSWLVEQFTDYKQGFKLAYMIRRFATPKDVQLLWRLHRHRHEAVSEAVRETLPRIVSKRHHRVMSLAARSTSARTRELFLEMAFAVATVEELENYRDALDVQNTVGLRRAMLALGSVGRVEDVERLRETLMRRKFDQRTREIGLAALAALLARVGDQEELRKMLHDRKKLVVRAAIRGMTLCGTRLRGIDLESLYPRYPEGVARLWLKCGTPSDRQSLRRVIRGRELGNVERLLAVALIRVGSARDPEYLLRLFARARGEVQFSGTGQLELVFQMAEKAKGDGLRAVLKRFIQTREFWEYYGEHRPRDRMPVRHHENVPFMRRLAGILFGEVARRSDMALLRRMLQHWYVTVQHGAANGLLRLGDGVDLNKIVSMAIERAEKREDCDGFMEGAYALDCKLYGNGVGRFPRYASYDPVARER